MTDKARIIRGPYGPYGHGSVGALLNACCEIEHVPLRIVEDLTVGVDEIRYRDKKVANYKWFDELDAPLILWVEHDFRSYAGQVMMLDDVSTPDEIKKRLIPKFRLTLSVHGLAAFEIDGHNAVPELHAFLSGMLTNYMLDPRYALQQNAGAFFQGGSDQPNGKWFLIEFWKPAGAKAFIDHINENYRPFILPIV